ncbi:MAG: ATP-dependent zinc metalloprotease FtsH [Candidatus Omnitrophica bacterium]|nr:ATP-dependent zinc metalloprotease FtsH [Candidatus Omnitrophota bacterium]
MMWVLLGLVMLYLWVAAVALERSTRAIPYNQFFHIVLENPQTQKIRSAALDGNRVVGELDDGTPYTVYIPEGDVDLIPTLRNHVPEFTIRPPWAWANLFYSFAPMLLFVFLFWFLIYRGAQQGGGRILSFGKSHAKQFSQDKVRFTFADVAGVDEAKEELQEIIEFLKDPKKFQKLGGRIPKGVLLMGPPGTGKTLLAKAVAGEAHVPFFSISGSDFVEMFVGVGASRVRDLFEQGKRAAKASGRGAIIFIDEIDAVGRLRFAGIGGGHDEREQTLNALLVEMDGFDTQVGVILLAATNRPDVLDPALVRPGRFDRQIVIDRPDIVGREEILKVHTRNIRLDKDADLKKIARQTPGFSGADLASLVNEGALLAARRDKKAVQMVELESSIERVMAGPERKSRVISKQEKAIVAHHEAGHTLVALLVPKADPVHKVSIIPRGTAALGYTLQTPIEDRYLVSKSELLDKVTVLLGGRVAEELIFSEITSGAHNDLEVATDMAHRMVCEFGMSDKLGNLTLGRRDKQVFLGRDIMQEKNYSETTAVLIDQEVRRIIDSCYQRARGILTENLEKLKSLASQLLEREVLDGEEVRRIVAISGNGPYGENEQNPEASGGEPPQA